MCWSGAAARPGRDAPAAAEICTLDAALEAPPTPSTKQRSLRGLWITPLVSKPTETTQDMKLQEHIEAQGGHA
ncbi:hypothetical protein E2C01_071054 [Portunus trituberculatus]|uniref:Uncharacterized protein n=1 Tax=Portunus trituberculatus TaxID=210409 RepID=A0A5B7I595_PORTR|nr:hypothetical protein [Portunus trituberculatus]